MRLRHQHVMPFMIAEVKGFALAASKAVLGGVVGQMLTLARANLGNIPGVGVLIPA
jgi:hypothetical protein